MARLAANPGAEIVPGEGCRVYQQRAAFKRALKPRNCAANPGHCPPCACLGSRISRGCSLESACGQASRAVAYRHRLLAGGYACCVELESRLRRSIPAPAAWSESWSSARACLRGWSKHSSSVAGPCGRFCRRSADAQTVRLLGSEGAVEGRTNMPSARTRDFAGHVRPRAACAAWETLAVDCDRRLSAGCPSRPTALSDPRSRLTAMPIDQHEPSRATAPADFRIALGLGARGGVGLGPYSIRSAAS
jgi:hypothetical protein